MVGARAEAGRASATSRYLRFAVVVVLAIAALASFTFIHDFGQTRFFTIDEFQWGHATWLVAEGEVPYRDFYEHHFPLGYVLHSLLLQDDASFVERALRLRDIAFAYIALTALMLAGASYAANRSVEESLLSAILPASLGFSLMSAVDYRGDNWAIFGFLVGLAGIEINQRVRSRVLAAATGAALAAAVLMTQKIVLLGGFVVALMWLASVLVRRSPWRERLAALILPHPSIFVAAGTGVVVVALLVGGWLGVLGTAFEINILQAVRHEGLYPGFSPTRYIAPFLGETIHTTIPILIFAIFHLAGGWKHFWTLPLLAALLGALTIRAPFPYNFVLITYLLGICAVRGYCELVRRLSPEEGTGSLVWPLWYLVPLALLPNQLGYLSGTSGNEHQLEVLRKIEAYTGEDDIVIDSAGGALFRPHRSYYWYQGKAHIQMFGDYWEKQFVPDLRASRAPFWIRSVRFAQLPQSAKHYARKHYVPFHEELYVLGFTTPETSVNEGATLEIDIVRGGDYYISRNRGRKGSKPRPGRQPWTRDLRLDGEEIQGAKVHLREGSHSIIITPGAPSYRFSYLPPSAFGPPPFGRHHTPMFEFDLDERPNRSRHE
jgi:hypothetical protein